MNKSIPKSASLICGALLASVCVVESADAIPQTINFSAWVHIPGGQSQLSLATAPHVFGTQGQIVQAADPNYHVIVSSGPSPRPNPATPGQNWQYEMVVDWLPYNPGFLGGPPPLFPNRATVRLDDIKPPGPGGAPNPAPVTSFAVKRGDGQLFTSSNSSILPGGTGLLIDVQIGELINAATGNHFMIIQWNQAIPAPGALALLGLAGVVGKSRRRRPMLN